MTLTRSSWVKSDTLKLRAWNLLTRLANSIRKRVRGRFRLLGLNLSAINMLKLTVSLNKEMPRARCSWIVWNNRFDRNSSMKLSVNILVSWRASNKNRSWSSKNKFIKCNSSSSRINRNSATRNCSFKASDKSSTWNCNQNWKLKLLRRRFSKKFMGMRIKLGSMSRMIKIKASSRPLTLAWTSWEMKIRSWSKPKMKLRLGREHRPRRVNRKRIGACDSKRRKKKNLNKSYFSKNRNNRLLLWLRHNEGKPSSDKRQKKLR